MELSQETLGPSSVHSSLWDLRNVAGLLSASESLSLNCDPAAEVRTR